MKKEEEDYKKLLDTSIINHRKEMWQKMMELRSKKSKEYWKILNSGCRKKQPNISISSLFDFFKRLNETPYHIGNDYDLLDIEPHFINTPNMEINGQRWCVKGVSRRFVSYELLPFVIVYIITLHPWKRTLHGWTARRKNVFLQI